MAEQIALISVRPLWAGAPLLLLAAAALAASWYALRWGVGDTMAEYAPVSYQADPTAAFETAEAAARLDPEDPLAHLTLARLYRVSFDPEDLPRSLAEYDRAAALAPNYAEPRWHLGNALLRAGRADEAFAELRRASDADPERYRPQAFNLAWQVYGPDMARVVEAVGRTPDARAQLVGVLVGRGRLDDAGLVWSSLGAQERREQGGAGAPLARALYDRGQYHRALQ